MKKTDWVQRFWGKVQFRSVNECWEWMGGRFHYGHGQFSLRPRNLKAHRVAYELINGPINKGFCIRHSCDNPPCCNPNHLLIGTLKDNTRDMYDRGRAADRKGEKHGGHVLTEKQVIEIRSQFIYSRGIYGRIANEYGVERKTIYNLIHRRSWAHV